MADGPCVVPGHKQDRALAHQHMSGMCPCRLIPLCAGFAPTALADGSGGSLAREELSFIMIKPDGVHRGLIAGGQHQVLP
jgi:hypothetical protein